MHIPCWASLGKKFKIRLAILYYLYTNPWGEHTWEYYAEFQLLHLKKIHCRVRKFRKWQPKLAGVHNARNQSHPVKPNQEESHPSHSVFFITRHVVADYELK